MALLDRSAILAAPDLPTEEVEVPEWGGSVRLRGLTQGALSTIRTTTDGASADAFMLAVLVPSLVDATNVPLFGDPQELTGKSPEVLNRLFAIAARLNGFGKESSDTLGKTSGGDPSAATPSGSPSASA